MLSHLEPDLDSLHQRRRSFGMKVVLLGFTKNTVKN